jgi:hypothetical protein
VHRRASRSHPFDFKRVGCRGGEHGDRDSVSRTAVYASA